MKVLYVLYLHKDTARTSLVNNAIQCNISRYASPTYEGQITKKRCPYNKVPASDSSNVCTELLPGPNFTALLLKQKILLRYLLLSRNEQDSNHKLAGNLYMVSIILLCLANFLSLKGTGHLK